ncbi:MAG: hypothetical protein WC028_24610 [Candidatus Obscuribacterales bacterium]
MEQSETKTEWTVEQVTQVVTAIVKKRHDVDFATYVAMVKRNDENLDRCRDSDILGLLKLIGVEAEVLAAA